MLIFKVLISRLMPVIMSRSIIRIGRVKRKRKKKEVRLTSRSSMG